MCRTAPHSNRSFKTLLIFSTQSLLWRIVHCMMLAHARVAYINNLLTHMVAQHVGEDIQNCDKMHPLEIIGGTWLSHVYLNPQQAITYRRTRRVYYFECMCGLCVFVYACLCMCSAFTGICVPPRCGQIIARMPHCPVCSRFSKSIHIRVPFRMQRRIINPIERRCTPSTNACLNHKQSC